MMMITRPLLPNTSVATFANKVGSLVIVKSMSKPRHVVGAIGIFVNGGGMIKMVVSKLQNVFRSDEYFDRHRIIHGFHTTRIFDSFGK